MYRRFRVGHGSNNNGEQATHNTTCTARLAHSQTRGKMMQILLKDNTQIYKQFAKNASFPRYGLLKEHGQLLEQEI